MHIRATCIFVFSYFLVIAEEHAARTHLASEYFKWRHVGAINVFMCSVKETYKTIRYLMLHRQYQFCSVASGLSLLTEPQLFLPLMTVSQFKLGVLLDYSCEFGKRILNQSSEQHMFNVSYSWLILGEDTSILKELGALNFGLDSEAALALHDGTIWDLYKVNYTTPLNAVEAGHWNDLTELDISLSGTKIQRRSNFQGIKFKGTFVLAKLQVNLNDTEKYTVNSSYHPHLDSLSRFTLVLFLKLQDIYNFTLSLQLSHSWGYLMPNGGHDGMVGQLERGEIDIGLSPATMYAHRMDTVDFAHSVWKFRHPSTMGVYKALVTPLTVSAWIYTGIILVIIVAALRLIHYYEVTGWADTELSWSASIVLVVGAIAQQGLSQTSYRVSVRIIALFLLILSVVLYAFYGAAIVTSLLTPPSKTIRTIRQLMDSSIGMGVEDTPYTRDYFSTSTDPLTAMLYKKKLQKPTGFMSVPDGIERMRTKAYAFYAEDTTLYRPINMLFSNSEKCSLTEIELFSPYLSSPPVQKGSPLKDFISCGLLLMRERGIMDRENKAWHPHRPNLCVDEKLVAKVNMEAVMLAFIVLLAGIVLSLVILCWERYVYKRRSQQSLKRKGPTNKMMKKK